VTAILRSDNVRHGLIHFYVFIWVVIGLKPVLVLFMPKLIQACRLYYLTFWLFG